MHAREPNLYTSKPSVQANKPSVHARLGPAEEPSAVSKDSQDRSGPVEEKEVCEEVCEEKVGKPGITRITWP